MFSTMWKQVDLGEMVLTLNPRQTKALKKRTIPISDRLASVLQELGAQKPHFPKDLIFDGHRSYYRAFKTACKRAGIDDLHFHDLRHTSSTWLDEAGISDPARRNILGHGSVRTGMRYVNPTQDVMRSVRVKMNEYRERMEKQQD